MATGIQVNRNTVRLWREWFPTRGSEGLWEIAPGRGRKATYSAGLIKTIIDATLQSKPAVSKHWCCRSMAAAVKRLWTASFTLFSAGWEIVMLMALYWIVDVKQKCK